jgi:hypothetical protein
LASTSPSSSSEATAIPGELATAFRFVEKHDAFDLAQRVGALQLVPQNAHHMTRLEVAASLVAKSRAMPTAAPSPTALNNWLNGPRIASAQVAAFEDEYSDLFTEEISFHGGSFSVLPGFLENAPYVLQRVLQAIFLGPWCFDPSELTRLAVREAKALLRLSDEIIRRAELPRYCPVGERGREAFIPRRDPMRRLMDAVTFNGRDLEQLGIEPRDLNSFVADPVTLDITGVTRGEFPVCRWPIVANADRWAVVAPWNLIVALKHRLLCLVIEHDRRDAFTSFALMHTLENVVRSLGVLRIEPSGVEVPRTSEPWIRDDVFSMDTDKALHTLIIQDSLEDFDYDDPFGQWNASGVSALVGERCRAVEGYLLSGPNAPNDILHLTLLQGLGRQFFLGLADEDLSGAFPVLPLSPSSLEVVAMRMHGNQLLLWQYAHAKERLLETTRVLAFDDLGPFSIYEGHHHSFYLSDERSYGQLSIDPATGPDLRADVRRQNDVHCVPNFDAPGTLEVAHVEQGTPIFAPVPRTGYDVPVAHCVEGLPVLVWVVAAGTADAERSWQWTIVELVSYWIWQLTDTIRPWVLLAAGRIPFVHCRLAGPEPPSGGSDVEPDVSQDSHAEVNVQWEEDGTLDVVFAQSFKDGVMGPDNTMERKLVAELVRAAHGFGRHLGGAESEALDDATVQQIVDGVAPLGSKKKMVAYDAHSNPRLVPTGLQPRRYVQDYNLQVLHDEIGRYVRESLGYDFGDVPTADCNRILRSVVAHLFGLMERLVASLSPQLLLEYLIAFSERYIYEEAHSRLTLPTRIACYGSVEEMLEKLGEEYPNASNASSACRFVVEYVAARPPNGLRPFSLSVFDELMALSQIIRMFGDWSDAVEYQLTTINLTVLRSGRLAVDDDKYHGAQKRFLGEFLYGHLGRSLDRFADHWPPNIPSESAQRLSPEDIEAATLEEFGVSYSDLKKFVTEVYAAGIRFDGSPCVMSVSDLLAEVQAQLRWDELLVRQALNFFSLKPRDNYLIPPPGFTRPDIYPWRHGRRLTFLRRPLIIRRSDAGDEAVWGNRGLAFSLTPLNNTATGGPYAATSPKMRRLQGQRTNIDGAAFNDKVAEVLDATPGIVVRRRVKQVGELKLLRPNGEPLGDIDVLVLAPAERRILAVETKDLSMSLTPYEIRNELQELYGDGQNDRGKLGVHGERVQWLRDHVAACLEWAKMPVEEDGAAAQWRVDGLVVVDQELASPFYVKSEFPTMSARRLKDKLGRLGLSAFDDSTATSERD